MPLVIRIATSDAVEQYLKNLEKCKDPGQFVQFQRTVRRDFYVTLPAETQSDVFDKLVAKFSSSKILGAVKDAKTFADVLGALPFYIEPGTGERTDVVETLPIEAREDVYKRIYDKWLNVWPVSSLVLPNDFWVWLSGGLRGATTPDEELSALRTKAKDTIYEKWLATVQDEIQIRNVLDFVGALQVVPAAFWQWPEVRAETDKREQVWRQIHTKWRSIRPHTTGLVDLPFWSDWAVANAKLPDEAKTAGAPPGVSKALDEFYRSRSGVIWA